MGVVVDTTTQAGDEAAVRVGAADVGERGGVAGEEGGSGWVVGGAVMAACGARDPREVAAGVDDEMELLGRGSDGDSGEVLAGAGGGAGDEWGGDAVAVGRERERGEAVMVEEEDVRRGFGVGNVD